MTDRRRRILALAGSLYDLLPAPKGSLSGARPGLAPSAKAPCPDCGHSDTPGWKVDRFKRREPCLICGGRLASEGVRAKKGRGVVDVDPMDAEHAPIRTAEANARPTKPASTRRCDGCGGTGDGGMHLDPQGREYRGRCGYCGGSGRRVIASTPLGSSEPRDDGTALEEALTRRSETGDWRALEEALAVLPTRWRRLFTRVHVHGADGRLTEDEAMALEIAVRTVDWLMPDPVRVPAAILKADHDREARRALAHGRGAGKQALAKRDGEIRKLARQGRPTQWIAQQYELSPQQTRAIIAGEAAA